MAARSVKIEMKDESLAVRLAWDCFDGDDCFEDFRITIAPSRGARRIYEFGPCAVRAVRKMKQFLSDSTIASVSGKSRAEHSAYFDIRFPFISWRSIRIYLAGYMMPRLP